MTERLLYTTDVFVGKVEAGDDVKPEDLPLLK